MSAPLSIRARGGGVLALARTQYLEVTRQPVFGVVLAVGLVMIALAPVLAVFSLGQRAAEALVMDLGASSMLFFSVFLAAAAVAAGAAERLADGTTPLVLTKPVDAATVLLGGLLGAAAALAQAGLLLGVALLWAARHGPHALHAGVLWGAGLWLAGALAWGLRASLRRRPFQPAVLRAGTVLAVVCYLGSLLLGRDSWGAISLPVAAEAAAQPDGTAVAAAYLAYLASVAYAGLGLALAARLPPAAAAALTLVGFLLGSIVQAGLGEGAGTMAAILGGLTATAGAVWLVMVAFRTHLSWGLGLLLGPVALFFGLLVFTPFDLEAVGWATSGGALLLWLTFVLPRLRQTATPLAVYVIGLGMTWFGATVLQGGALTLLVPDVQLYWIADAAYTGELVPLAYLVQLTGYTALYALGALAVGAFLLEGRELG